MKAISFRPRFQSLMPIAKATIFPRLIRCFQTILLAFALTRMAEAVQPRVAILGDSITFDGRWANLVESALRGTPQFADAEIVNFGLSSETVSGLSEAGHAGGKFPRPCLHERLGRILEGYHPTLVLACYGMNDGIYLPPDEARMEAYRNGILKLKSDVEKSGASVIFITPPLHQADKPSDDPNRYDAVLDGYGEWLVARRADGWQVIDIRPDLRKGIAAEKGRDPKFVYAGDGVHPGDVGHRLMAESIASQLWPILKLPGAPNFPDKGALDLLKRRGDLLKLAWLTKTGHTRPGVPKGLPIEEAEVQAKKLMEEFRNTTPPKTADWNGYERLDFNFEGRKALLVRPKTAAPGNPWIWRTEFFGHEPQGDIGLLGKGFHVAYIDMQNLYGAPTAMTVMDHFHAHLVQTYQLAPKVVLEGFSRGGLYAFNWAELRPDKVAGLYVDAPVCDFKSWPGGKGSGRGSSGDWKRLQGVYGFKDEAEALAFPTNPVDHLKSMAKAKIPVLAVVGQADDTVPVSENIDLVEQRYKAMGGKIEIIRKPGCNHHPHSLEDPAPIVKFVVGCYP